MTASIEEVLDRLAEASAGLDSRIEGLANENGHGPDEDLRADALAYADEVEKDADLADQVEAATGSVDRSQIAKRVKLRERCDDVREAINGAGDRARQEAFENFTNETGENTSPFEHLRIRLKCPDLKRVIKHGRSNSLWDLELNNGDRIPLGNSEQIQEPKKVRAALLSASRHIKRMKLADHDVVVEALTIVAEEVDSVASEVEETLGWLASFMHMSNGAPPRKLEGDELRHLLEDPDEVPVFRDGDDRLYLRLQRLSQHVTKSIGQRTTSRDLAARLSRAGFKKHQLGVRDGEDTYKARYWRSRAGFDFEGGG